MCRPAGFVPARDFAAGARRAGVEGSESAAGRVVRPVRQRPDGAQGVAGPVCRSATAIDIASANNPIATSVNSVNRTWNDANGELRPGLRLDAISPRTASAAPIANRELRQEQPQRHALCRRCAQRLRRPRLHLGFRDGSAARAPPGVSVTGGYYRNWAGNFRRHRQPGGDACGLQSVLHHGAGRSAAAGRRRLPGLRPVRRRAAKFGQVNNLVTQASHYYGTEASHLRVGSAGCSGLRHLGLLRRQRQHAARLGHPARRRRGHRAHGDRQLLCGRFPAATAELPCRHAVQGPDAGQAVRQLPVAGRLRA